MRKNEKKIGKKMEINFKKMGKKWEKWGKIGKNEILKLMK